MNMNDIHLTMVEYYGCEFLLNTRQRIISDRRKLFIYICRRRTNATIPQITKYCKFSNHSSTIYAIKAITLLLEQDRQLSNDLIIVLSLFRPIKAIS